MKPDVKHILATRIPVCSYPGDGDDRHHAAGKYVEIVFQNYGAQEDQKQSTADIQAVMHHFF